MRDHLLNPDTARLGLERVEKEKEADRDGDEIRIQMGVVQGVRDQLENALNALRAVGGDVGMDGAQVCFLLHIDCGMETDERHHHYQ